MNKLLKSILIASGIVIIIVLAIVFYPFRISQTEKNFTKKIENIKSFRDEATAMSLSLPLLTDTIIKVYSDSLLITLIDLNKSWVIFIRTCEEYNEYTSTIKTLNESLELLRIQYEMEKELRIFKNTIKEKENFIVEPDSKKIINV